MWFSFLQSSDAFAKKYDIKSKVLGQGKFAKVYEATERETGQVYAVKVILKEALCGPAYARTRLESVIRVREKTRASSESTHTRTLLTIHAANLNWYVSSGDPEEED